MIYRKHRIDKDAYLTCSAGWIHFPSVSAARHYVDHLIDDGGHVVSPDFIQAFLRAEKKHGRDFVNERDARARILAEVAS